MTQIEQIRQEIERHRIAIRVLNEHTTPEQTSKTCAVFQYADSILSELNSFIDTLKQPQLPSEDLEEAARLYAIPHYMKDIDMAHIDEYPYDKGLEAAFKAGAEWQEQQDLKSMAEIYKNGYNLCKQQMLKDAVKGTVCKDKKGVWIEFIPNALPDYEDIEPVKCIVMKEEEK